MPGAGMAAGLPGASSPDGGGKTSPKTFSTTRPRSVKTAPEDATNVRHGKSVVAAKAAEAGAGDGPQISYPADAYLPFRPAMRKVFDQIRTEFIVTGLVLINMLGLLIDMVVTENACPVYGNVSSIQECEALSAAEPWKVVWNNSFEIEEIVFLTFFSLEILLRIYAYGFRYGGRGKGAGGVHGGGEVEGRRRRARDEGKGSAWGGGRGWGSG